MKPKALVVALILSTVSGLFADSASPEPGYYVGSLLVTKVHFVDGLSTSYTLRAQARVNADGTISIATTVPESPAAASNVESTLNRAAPFPTSSPTLLGDELIILLGTDPVTLGKTTSNYLIDSKYRAELKTDGNVFKLRYSNPPAGYQVAELGSDQVSIRPNEQFTMFSFTLRKRR